MPSILPKEPVAPTRFNPKIFMLYGMPKIGKTQVLTELPGCLILDLEKGADTRASLRVPIRAVEGANKYVQDDKAKDTDVLLSATLDSTFTAFVEEAQRQKAAGEKLQYPYKYIAIDTVDQLEEMCEASATRKYKETTIGKTFEGKSVLELPKGLGYYYLRNEVLDQINRFAGLCETLILVSHVKDKIQDKGGIEVTTKDLSLTGKLSGIVSAKCDAIGFLYRENASKPLSINFETFDAVMGARFPHLAGKRFEFDWKKIFLSPEQAK